VCANSLNAQRIYGELQSQKMYTMAQEYRRTHTTYIHKYGKERLCCRHGVLGGIPEEVQYKAERMPPTTEWRRQKEETQRWHRRLGRAAAQLFEGTNVPWRVWLKRCCQLYTQQKIGGAGGRPRLSVV